MSILTLSLFAIAITAGPAAAKPAPVKPAPASTVPTTAATAAADAKAARPPAAPITGPCADKVRAIRPGTMEPEPFLAAAACLRKLEAAGIPAASAAAAAPPATRGDSPASGASPASDAPPAPAARGDSPASGAPPVPAGRPDTSAAGAPPAPAAGIPADSALKRLLPPGEGWYVAQLERLRSRRDLARLQSMAWLATLRDPPGPDTWREISESHSLAGDAYHAVWALLKQAEKDSTQGGYIQYQLDALLRSHAEPPAPVLLDSLTTRFRHARPVTAEVLESLCWQHRSHAAAYRNTLAWMDLAKPGPVPVLDRAGRYHLAGWSDHAAGVLARSGWRGYSQPYRVQARALFLRVSFQLEDWPAIAAEADRAPKGSLSEEEENILAAASLRQGRPQEALDRLGRFESGGESPWGYRAQMLKARALLALGRLPEAARALDALKRSPRRREGTGPILFWQGWLALQQGQAAAAESLLVLASAYTGSEESQRALEYRYWILLDSGAARVEFFRGLSESPLPAADRIRSLDRVPGDSPLWPFARIEKAQILAAGGRTDSARAVLDEASRLSRDRLAGLKAESMAAWLQEKAPGGREAALARYENLLIEYQQGVVPEFSRGRIRALK